ncbi:MAG: hypothetical protein IPP78_09160 [Holophagaceae bacterium]|nr:hypothetical protein [Holophagaceae bacterium]
MASTSIHGSDTYRAVARSHRFTELSLPPMFFIRMSYRETPPMLTVNDLPAPEKFHERLAAWLMKQH